MLEYKGFVSNLIGIVLLDNIPQGDVHVGREKCTSRIVLDGTARRLNCRPSRTSVDEGVELVLNHFLQNSQDHPKLQK